MKLQNKQFVQIVLLQRHPSGGEILMEHHYVTLVDYSKCPLIYRFVILIVFFCSLKLHNEKRPLSMKTDIIKKRQRTEALLASTANDQLKKPKYFDHLSLYSNARGKNTSTGYKNSSSSLPGTGILMMTSSGHGH